MQMNYEYIGSSYGTYITLFTPIKYKSIGTVFSVNTLINDPKSGWSSCDLLIVWLLMRCYKERKNTFLRHYSLLHTDKNNFNGGLITNFRRLKNKWTGHPSFLSILSGSFAKAIISLLSKATVALKIFPIGELFVCAVTVAQSRAP